MTKTNREKIAIVGSGITGLTCAWMLKDRYDVHLFEADDRLGGHTNTVEVELDGRLYAVDTGFIVHNDLTYPNFVEIMNRLGVQRNPTEMSFSVRCEQTGLEYNGTSLNTLFAQRKNIVSPRFWRLLRGILAFNNKARQFLQNPDPKLTLGSFLQSVPVETVENYVMPMGAAVWSTSLAQMLDFPALFFVRFFANHGFLNIEDRPQWKVIQGGSGAYVEKMIESFSDRIHTSTPIAAVVRKNEGVELLIKNESMNYDRVILAVHSDQALKMLAQPTQEERAVLGAIPYTRNEAWLHTDTRFQPKTRRAWASWNYHLAPGTQHRVTVTYNMNILQKLEAPHTFLVTLNPHHDIQQDKVLKKIIYHHPLFTLEGMAAQARVSEINSKGRVYFCGAWHRNGFHEDGVWSALQVCEQLGVTL